MGIYKCLALTTQLIDKSRQKSINDVKDASATTLLPSDYFHW